jgi:hypothetical protein
MTSFHRFAGRRSIAWTCGALAVLMPTVSDAAFCEGKTASAAEFAKTVADKFPMAAAMCDSDALPKYRPLPATPHVRVVAPVSQHSEHLSLFETFTADMAPALDVGPMESRVPAPAPVRGKNSITIIMSGAADTTLGAKTSAGGMSRTSIARALELAPQVKEVADAYRIDPLLLHAIAQVESSHNTAAVSPAGARGLMQVMPATARRFGVDQPHSQLHNARTSLEVSSAYLKTLQQRFGNNLELVLAAYNAGEGAVEKYGRRIPPYAETQGYVKKVMANYQLLRNASAVKQPAAAVATR